MCITPLKLSDGTLIACRKCWQCRENRVNDWVGRCIAESETAVASNSITLTYGRDEDGNDDHLRAAVLTYSDVQKYFKLLRRHGYPCRYFAIGEYGSVKGRSHWHVVVFWQGDVPPHDLESRFMERHWPHGWSYWEKPNPAAIRYVCKYIQKDMGKAERQGHLAMSKKPPLGHEYFQQLAGRYVDQGVAPIEPYYWFGHVLNDEGKPVKFYMSGVTLDNFCQAFLDQWAARYGTHPPHSQVIEDYEDRMAKRPEELRLERFVPRVAAPWIDPPHGAVARFSEPHNAYYADTPYGRLWWSYDMKGSRAWQDVIRTEAEADRLRIDAERFTPAHYLSVKNGGGRV